MARSSRKGVPHRRRPDHDPRHPLHVAVRMVKRCWNLRSRRAFRRVRAAFIGALGRFGTRIIEYSVQGNHLHLIVEAADRVALGRAMKGLGVRIARRLNRMMQTRGRVIRDRYYARALRNPLEVRRALQYVLNNYRRHAAERGQRLPPTWIDPFSTCRAFSGWHGVTPALRARVRDPCPALALGVLAARTRLLCRDWRRSGLLELDHEFAIAPKKAGSPRIKSQTHER